jgi:glycosyltransferase involved in cell wall biosynthesis
MKESQMRIALIASSLRLAGAEKQFTYLARALRAQGLDARVFYLGNGDHYQTVLEEAGVPLVQIFEEDRPVKMLWGLVKALLTFKPSVVLASQFGDLVFAAPAGRLCRALVLGGVRSDGHYELRTAGRRAGLLLRFSDGLIANSNRAKENLLSRAVAAAKIAVIPNVIDLAEFDSKAALPSGPWVPDDRVQVTAVGSLDECKRFDRFLEALVLARQREPAIFGVLAGRDTGAGEALEKKAKALGLTPEHFRFLGEYSHVPALLSASRLLVLCSEYEGFPNVILEAMAASLPVVTTPVGDASRIVQDGITGYVVPGEDRRAIADRIVQLVRNPDGAAQMGRAGRQRVEQEYSFSSLADRFLGVVCGFARATGRTLRGFEANGPKTKTSALETSLSAGLQSSGPGLGDR